MTRARRKAKLIIRLARTPMALEGQTAGLRNQEETIEELANEMVREMPRDFWKRHSSCTNPPTRPRLRLMKLPASRPSTTPIAANTANWRARTQLKGRPGRVGARNPSTFLLTMLRERSTGTCLEGTGTGRACTDVPRKTSVCRSGKSPPRCASVSTTHYTGAKTGPTFLWRPPHASTTGRSRSIPSPMATDAGHGSSQTLSWPRSPPAFSLIGRAVAHWRQTTTTAPGSSWSPFFVRHWSRSTSGP